MMQESIAGFRLSPQQRHLWRLLEMQSTSTCIDGHPEARPSFYNQAVVRITGEVNQDHLGDVLQQIVDHYEILRTSYQTLPGTTMPVQVIAEGVPILLNARDLRQFDDEEQKTQIDEILCYGVASLSVEETFGCALITVADDESWLILQLSALCGDGATLDQLIAEIASTYADTHQTATAVEDGHVDEGNEEDEALQYADLAEWLNGLLEDEDATEALDYWRQQDLTALFDHRLPTEIVVGETVPFVPEGLTFTLNATDVALASTVCAEAEVELAELLLTTWQILLWRLTGQQQQILGVRQDGRADEELAEAMGLLTRHLPLQTSMRGDESLRTLLTSISERVAEGRDLQEYFNWESVSNASMPTDEPFLPYSFGINEMLPPLQAGDVTFTMLQRESLTDRFKLHLQCTVDAAEIRATLHYDQNSFTPAAIARLAEQYQTLLANVLRNPNVPIDILTVVGPNERQQLLVDFNQTNQPIADELTFVQRFEQQATKTPDAIAVAYKGTPPQPSRAQRAHGGGGKDTADASTVPPPGWGRLGGSLTYADLNNRANQLAHHLKGLSVGPESVVALCQERSPEMVVALLAVLKAGGAYLPLDPSHPQTRLAFILADADVQVVLTQERLLTQLPDAGRIHFCLDRDWSQLDDQPMTDLPNRKQPDNLAYVIYTSGSTGEPKGVMVEERNLGNYLSWAVDAYQIARGSGTLVQSPLAFDLTITSLLAPLTVGQQVILLPEEDALDTLHTTLANADALTLLKITPAHLDGVSHLLEESQAAGRTQAFIIGGEALLGEHIAFWQEHAPQTRLINEYGPTETVVGCCVYEAKADEQFAAAVPIGRPIANTQLYVLDSHGKPVPTGVPGELYIGGAGVARGYLHRPELTAERFVADPFSGDPQARLYRTGDLVRHIERADGLQLEYLGRIDQQVKVRGYRIELGEIEVQLLRHPAVKEVAVVASEDERGQKRLVAYVVGEDRSRAQRAPVGGEGDVLQEHLAKTLPGYMIPLLFIPLDALPLTRNGKVDRDALPAPEQVQSRATYVAPRNETEEMLAAIWAELLGVERIGIHDNFFGLGGDSIQSIQVVARANKVGLDLTMQQMFQYQTIATLSEQIGLAVTTIAEQGEVTGAVPLTPIQRWFLAQQQPVPGHYNQSIVVGVAAQVDPTLLEEALQALVQHHDALRLRFVQTRNRDGWVQENAPYTEQRLLTIVDLSELTNGHHAEREAAAIADCHNGFDLSAGCLLRALLIRNGVNQPARLHLVINHLAVDGLSWRILLEDLQHSYQQLATGQSVELPAKNSSFQLWAERLQRHANRPDVNAELTTWQTQAWDQVHALPVDAGDISSENTVATTATVTTTLDKVLTESLLHEAQQAYHTQINELLLTALFRAMKQWTGDSTLLVELEGHGRESLFADVDLSRTVGWFTTIYPVLLQFEQDDAGASNDIGVVIKAVKEQIRQIPRNGIGYGLLRYLNEETAPALASLPQADLLFNYLGQFDDIPAAETSSFVGVNGDGSNGNGNHANGTHTNGAYQNDTPYFFPVHNDADANGEFESLNQSPQGQRSHLLEINCMVVNGMLQVTWNYSQAHHTHGTITQLANAFDTALQEIIRHCQTPESGSFTPSDFPEARLAQEDLDTLLAKIGQVG